MNTTESLAAHAADRVVPNIADQLELIVCSLECRLLEMLTPEQFTLVQQLVDATRILAENEAVMRVASPPATAPGRAGATGEVMRKEVRHDVLLTHPSTRRAATA